MDYISVLSNKIITLNKLKFVVKSWRLKNDKVVFTNGCFDILHRGHVDYLAKARSLGSRLIVGVNTDSSVKRLEKGEDRPINNEQDRAFLLASLHVVDAVVLFDDDTPLHLIEQLEPDILVKGADWDISKVVGGDFVKSKGGEVLTIDLVEGYSTTQVIQKIRNSK
jgi:D-glycero-beta-D-manno-heptose 1-phosphate adenylyltransferase